MRRLGLFVLAALLCGVAAVLFARPGLGPGARTATSERPTIDTIQAAPPPSLAAAPPSARSPKAPAGPADPTPPTPAPATRRVVRARLVAVDVRTDQPIDPGADFDWSIRDDCEVLAESWRKGSRPQVVAALLPAGADETFLMVTIEGWGYRPVRQQVTLHARDGEVGEEVRIPLEPVAEGVWSTARLLLAGEGSEVSAEEAIELRIAASHFTYGPSILRVRFAPGSPRAREIRVPFPAADLEILALPRRLEEAGRRIWIDAPRVRVDSAQEGAEQAVAFTIVRRPAATLELEIHYPPGDRPEILDFIGSLSGSLSSVEPGTPGRGFLTTFNVHVEHGPDLVRVEREQGRLKSLGGRADGFTVTVDPPAPYELRRSERTHVRVELQRVVEPHTSK